MSNHTKIEVHALYLHVPFCVHKCHYCDFYSIAEGQRTSAKQPRLTVNHRPVDQASASGDTGPRRLSGRGAEGLSVEEGPEAEASEAVGAEGSEVMATRHGQFTDAMIAELDHWSRQTTLGPSTIFVGGGTPTMLEPEHWRRLLAAMRDRGVLEHATEFTVEANPETVTDELLGVLVEGGVNRLSIGAQSFQPDLLKTLERRHDPASVPRAVEMARRAGIDAVNLDLIFAVPGQSLAQFDADLDAALACEPTHVSCYGLTFEPNTALTVKRDRGRITPMDDEHQSELYDRLLDRLDRAGFAQYEISNWARSAANRDYRCAHNLHYWHNANWLGLGPSAASHLDGHRWRNQPHLGKYLDHGPHPRPPTVDHERLDEQGRAGEQLMLGLRLIEGIDRRWFDHHFPHRRAKTEHLITLGLVQTTHTAHDAAPRLALTHRGLHLADAIIAALM